MGTPHIHRDVIIAWANGEDIEYWSDTAEKWYEDNDPAWRDHMEYRIKPKTVKKEGWVNIYTGFSGGLIVAHTGGPVYRTEKTADLSDYGNRVACVRIEWEEEV